MQVLVVLKDFFLAFGILGVPSLLIIVVGIVSSLYVSNPGVVLVARVD